MKTKLHIYHHDIPEKAGINSDPYIMPEGFLDALEAHVVMQVSNQEQKRKLRLRNIYKIGMLSFMSAAASAIIAIALMPGIIWHNPANQITLDQAFESLSETDQQYLIDNYVSDMSAMDYAEL